ncbi:PEP-CTERM sorting domain-containing protein [Geminocystis sp. GBBB08]|uniref:PEP-CTERM sorting domain-containing protein n=1 Tax=Geminocystis sp. GBBB08 TaxID=2604140 RepID=UPI0027E2FCE0|nr:PEP-CTERM sorting domain-containing protein [Geminocystis sp. GBBB08]MBL1210849.1 PEP-CTERM sorting domain-containing protein [Geminocystis sp. GBBB08]
MKSYLSPAFTVGIFLANIGQAQAVTITFDSFNAPFGSSAYTESGASLFDLPGNSKVPSIVATASQSYTANSLAVTRNSSVDGYSANSVSAPVPVPEPVTILGSLLAGGIGVAIKKKRQSLQA